MGTLYDFPKDYIEFSGGTNDEMGKFIYSKKILEKALAPNNILGLLRYNKEAQEINDYIKESLKEESNVVFRTDLHKIETKTDKAMNATAETNPRDSIQKINHFEDMDELSFLASIFNSDLDEVINSKEFEKN